MARRIALVACVKTKEAVPMPARHLYSSDWFRKASAYAERGSDSWYILSAKYGLLMPDTIIEPYEQTVRRMRPPDRRKWAQGVIRDLGDVLRRGDHVIVLASQGYRRDLINPIRKMGCTVEIPMEGLGWGNQLKWLKRHASDV